MQVGTDPETVVRWLVALVVLLIDPSAIVLTIAAARGPQKLAPSRPPAPSLR